MYTPAIASASALALSVAAYHFGTPIIISELARRDILWTTLDEGRGKVIVANGALYGVIMARRGFHLNRPGKPGHDPQKPDWEQLPDIPGITYDERSNLLKSHGVHWVGWPWQHQIRSYQFAWNELHQKNGGEMEAIGRNESTVVFMANDFPYVMKTGELRTKDNLPVRLECVVTVWLNNPVKALFATNDWRSQIQALIDRESKNFVGDFSYDELRSETDGDGGDISEDYSKRLTALTHKDPGSDDGLGTAEAHGVTIRSVSMRSLQLVGEFASEFERASTARYTAEADKITRTTAADAAAYETIKTGEAEADIIKAKGEAQGAADKARLEPITDNLEAARILHGSEALMSPGQGKVIAIDTGFLGSVLKAGGAVAEKLAGAAQEKA